MSLDDSRQKLGNMFLINSLLQLEKHILYLQGSKLLVDGNLESLITKKIAKQKSNIFK